MLCTITATKESGYYGRKTKEKCSAWGTACQGIGEQKHGGLLCGNKGRGGQKSTRADSGGKYDQYGRCLFRTRMWSD